MRFRAVLKTGQPARIDDYATASGIVEEPVRSIGIRGVVGYARRRGRPAVGRHGHGDGPGRAPAPADRVPPGPVHGPHRHRHRERRGALRGRRGSPKSRPRCGGWRRWSRTSRRPARCSRRSPRRWGGCWASRTRRSSAMKTTGPPPWSLTAASVTFPCRSAAACRWRERARLRWCGARGARPGSTTSRAPPGRSRITRATRASARPSAARSWSTVGSGAP